MPRIAPLLLSTVLLGLFGAVTELHAEAPVARCRALTGYRGALQSCAIDTVGGGTGKVVRIVTGCDGDSCSVSGWVHTRKTSGMRKLSVDAGGGLEIAPSGDFAVVDDVVSEGGEGRLLRVDLRTGATSPFASCLSPTLSPGKRWFVCRAGNGDVMRVRVGGGELERVASAGASVAGATSSRRPPDAVTFFDAGHCHFRVVDGDRSAERILEWRE